MLPSGKELWSFSQPGNDLVLTDCDQNIEHRRTGKLSGDHGAHAVDDHPRFNFSPLGAGSGQPLRFFQGEIREFFIVISQLRKPLFEARMLEQVFVQRFCFYFLII